MEEGVNRGRESHLVDAQLMDFADAELRNVPKHLSVYLGQMHTQGPRPLCVPFCFCTNLLVAFAGHLRRLAFVASAPTLARVWREMVGFIAILC